MPNLGRMRERCEILNRTIEPGPKGEQVKVFTEVGRRRGDWRQAGGQQFLLANAQMNIRSGTLLTHYFPDADESQFIRINGKDVYEVLTFNHDRNKSTLWTLQLLAL